jgi:hypothetical protein
MKFASEGSIRKCSKKDYPGCTGTGTSDAPTKLETIPEEGWIEVSAKKPWRETNYLPKVAQYHSPPPNENFQMVWPEHRNYKVPSKHRHNKKETRRRNYLKRKSRRNEFPSDDVCGSCQEDPCQCDEDLFLATAMTHLKLNDIEPHSGEERGSYDCNRCGQTKKGHICTFKVVGTIKIDKPHRDSSGKKYKCKYCNDFLYNHTCVPTFEPRTSDEMMLLLEFVNKCEASKKMYRIRDINSRIFSEGELEYEVNNFPLKWPGNVEPHMDNDEVIGRETQEDIRAVDPLLSPDQSEEESVEQTVKKDSNLETLLNNVTEFFKTFDSDICDDDMDKWVSHVENVVIFAYHLAKSESISDMFFAIMSYVKMNSKGSAARTILQYIDTVKAESETEVHAFNSRDLLDGWKLFRTNTIFKKISFLISAALSMSACSIRNVEWSIGGVELLKIEALEKQTQAVDVIDACIETFTWFVETGWEVIQQKSLYPVLFSNQKMKKFNDDCDLIFRSTTNIQAGNYDGDVHELSIKVEECLKEVDRLRTLKPDAPTATWLTDRARKLQEVKNAIVSHFKSSETRFFPACIVITGSSGVGKTGVSDLMCRVLPHAMGIKVTKQNIKTRNWTSEYDEEITEDTKVIKYDEIGAVKAAFAKHPEAPAIIRENNGVPLAAVKAALGEKGVVFFHHYLAVGTSNFHDLNFHYWTDYPSAALNRFWFVRQVVKPEFRKEGGLSLNTNHPKVKNSTLGGDFWDFKLERVIVYEGVGGKDAFRFETWKHDVDGKLYDTSKLTLQQLMVVLVDMVKVHKSNQDKVLSVAKQMDEMPLCDECHMYPGACQCDPCKNVPHALVEVDAISRVAGQALAQGITKYIKSFFDPVSILNFWLGFSPVAKMTTSSLAKEVAQLADESLTPFMIALTPQWVFRSRAFQRMVATWQKGAAIRDLRGHAKLISYVSLVALFVAVKNRRKPSVIAAAAACVMGSIGLYGSAYSSRLRSIKQEYLTRRDALPAYVQEVRDSRPVKYGLAVGTILIGVKMLRMWNKSRLSNVEPQTITPDEVQSQPGWFGFMMNKLGMSVESSDSMKCVASRDMLEALTRNNLFLAQCKAGNTSTKCNIFFPRKGIALMPSHVLYKDSNLNGEKHEDLRILVDRGSGKPGTTFEFTLDETNYVEDEELDLIAVFVPNCPDLKDRTEWLPKNYPSGSCIATFLARFANTGAEKERISVSFGTIGHKYKHRMYGGAYHTKMSRKGACMGMLISETKSPVILGFHIGGNPVRNNYGCMMTITQSKLQTLIERLDSKDHVLLPPSGGTMPDKQLGREVLSSCDVHPMSMAANLPQDAQVEVLGATKLRTKMKSRVIPSILSHHVEEECGVPSKWGKPKLEPNWKGYNATLEHIVNPAKQFSPKLLAHCVDDWLDPLLVIARNEKKIRRLTDFEAIRGVPGERFLEPLKLSTGMGFPVFGPKSRVIEPIWRDNEIVDYKIDPEVQAEVERLETCWSRGERAYPIVTATLKDEPTEIGKDKVRVFQAAPVAMSILIRKYFLPVAAFLNSHPIEAESAVGVNAFSDQWEKLMDHSEKFSNDGKVLAWDYSKFDVRMSSQITIQVWYSFLKIAKAAMAWNGWSWHDIYIMRNMIYDIVHPTIDWNGTLLAVPNINTSGNNLTVNVNGTAGSLYVRLGFFHTYPNLIGVKSFRECVSALTYGDDFKGSVDETYRDFNFESYADFLKEHDIKITPPDKSEDSFIFMDVEDADFLKRKSSYIEELGVKIGKLDEDSIFKSLHSNLRSTSASPEEVAVSCIEGAMHEWFAHGRSVYEMRQKQMKRVCNRVGLPVPAVDVTFDERVSHWKDKYVNKK